jgi:hypothetical protein
MQDKWPLTTGRISPLQNFARATGNACYMLSAVSPGLPKVSFRKLARSIPARKTAIAIAVVAFAIVSFSSVTGVLRAQKSARSGPNQRVEGQVPENWHPGTGTIITGDAADKATAAALAKYPGGTVNRVLKLSDGSYAVHMIKIRWPHHVFVSKSFEVTGAIG